jgi:hypothetical protein
MSDERQRVSGYITILEQRRTQNILLCKCKGDAGGLVVNRELVKMNPEVRISTSKIMRGAWPMQLDFTLFRSGLKISPSDSDRSFSSWDPRLIQRQYQTGVYVFS